MSRFKLPGMLGGSRPQDDDPDRSGAGSVGLAGRLVGLLMLAVVVYAGYFWFVRRVVVDSGEVLVLLKKNGSRSLPDGEVVIPRAPDRIKEPDRYAEWKRQYGDCNGILEAVYREGTYFAFSPFDYERSIVKLSTANADVPGDKVGVVIRKFGAKLDPGQVLADPARGQRGPLPLTLGPGKHPDFANPFAYEIKLVNPVQVNPGHRGVVTVMAVDDASRGSAGNDYLVSDNQQGVQASTELEGFIYTNPYQKRITPISIRSHRFEMTDKEAILFPSSDSFDIKMEGFVEWSIMPSRLPEIYVKYSEGADLPPLLQETLILPYARSFCRLVGSQYSARDFISGDTKLKFQEEFESKLREACAAQGVEIMQALVRDIIPPQAIKQPINEREIAKEQILQYEQQIKVAESQARLVTQEEMANQNQAIGEANKSVVTVVKKAEQGRDVTLTEAQQRLAVAKLQLEAAQKLADAQLARGQAEANVILLQKTAEAEPLRQQVQAFGDGEAYARFFFYQKIAPSVKTILSNTDGPFAELFNQFLSPSGASARQPQPQPGNAGKVTGVQP